MSRWKFRSTAGAVAAAGIVLAGLGAPAWSDGDASAVVEIDPEAFSSPAPAPGPLVSSDDRLADALASAGLEWFGGLYRDGDSTVITSTRPGVTGDELSKAVQTLVHVEILSGDDAFPSVRVKPADYAFGTLNAWKKSLESDFFALDGAVSSDLEERTGRVVLGFDEERLSRETVRAMVEREEVPSDAVEIRAESPMERQSLQDRSPWPLGGLQIENLDDNSSLCSLGFAARLDGVRGVVTAAHCTQTFGEVDGDRFFQPTSDAPNWYLGEETVDPDTIVGGSCPSGKECRWSDAAFIETVTSLPDAQGLVASMDHSDDPHAWTDRMDAIVSTGKPIEGKPVHKVGRTTGRTEGVIDRACVNVAWNEAGDNAYLFCQVGATYHARDGDSGGPVLGYTSVGGHVELFGVHHSANGTFSPMEFVLKELGPLEYLATGVRPSGSLVSDAAARSSQDSWRW